MNRRTIAEEMVRIAQEEAEVYGNPRIACHTGTHSESLERRTFKELLGTMDLCTATAVLCERDDGKGYEVSDGKYPPIFAEFYLEK